MDAGADTKNPGATAAPSKHRRARASAAASPHDDTNVSQVLRTVYQRAVDEDIPSEMLDLLSKLD